MTVLYDILTASDLKEITAEQKKEFLSEIILMGKYCYFEKFKGIVDGDVTRIISEERILQLLPTNIDDALFAYILSNYKFKNGQQFFYNFAIHSNSVRIKELVYDYFVENFSHVMIDNMDMYEALIEK